MAIKYINVDPLFQPSRDKPADYSIELYRNGEILVDLHADTTVLDVVFDGKTLTYSFIIGVWKHSREKNASDKEIITLAFKEVEQMQFNYNGYGMDDLSSFQALRVNNETDMITLEFASSFEVSFMCKEVELKNI